MFEHRHRAQAKAEASLQFVQILRRLRSDETLPSIPSVFDQIAAYQAQLQRSPAMARIADKTEAQYEHAYELDEAH